MPRPKTKVMRRFGEVLVPRPKYQKILERRPYPAGQHGKDKSYASRRRSNFAIQLEEKQKLRFIYNIHERQMRRYYEKAVQLPGETGKNLLTLMERRLDNIIYRAGFAPTIWAARQLVVHRHILVNGELIDRPAYSLKVGDEIAIKQAMRNNAQIQIWRDEASSAPEYIQVDREAFVAKLMYFPERKEIPVPIDEQKVVEYYNRRT